MNDEVVSKMSGHLRELVFYHGPDAVREVVDAVIIEAAGSSVQWADYKPPAPDLSRLEQELRGLVTSAGVQRIEGRADEAGRYAREAKVVRRCIAVMRGEVEPLEVEL